MELFKLMWDSVIELYSIPVVVFGVTFTFMQMFVFFTIVSIAIGILVGLFKN